MNKLTKLAAIVFSIGLFSSACNSTDEATRFNSAVSIQGIPPRGGGSGAIISTSSTYSKVLTNKHVCAVLKKNGGMVNFEGIQYLISHVNPSPDHDLCIVTVQANLKNSTRVASQPPKYGDLANPIGFPGLLGKISTTGHFSDRGIIEVLVGFRECTDADLKDPGKAMQCMFFGALPVISNYDSLLISATIMPGSSGSAVYNEDGYISGVVFAGRGDLGYGYIVPHEYVKNFVDSNFREFGMPVSSWVESSAANAESEKLNKQKVLRTIQRKCDEAKEEKHVELCKNFYNSFVE